MVENNKSPVEEAVCQRVLDRFAPRIIPTRVESLGNRGGFSGAGIWRVVTDRGNFALRRWPRSQLPPVRILGLHRLLTHLCQDGLTFVAVPLMTADGTTLPHESSDDWPLDDGPRELASLGRTTYSRSDICGLVFLASRRPVACGRRTVADSGSH